MLAFSGDTRVSALSEYALMNGKVPFHYIFSAPHPDPTLSAECQQQHTATATTPRRVATPQHRDCATNSTDTHNTAPCTTAAKSHFRALPGRLALPSSRRLPFCARPPTLRDGPRAFTVRVRPATLAAATPRTPVGGLDPPTPRMRDLRSEPDSGPASASADEPETSTVAA